MKTSAGILLYRKTNRNTEVFLVHPGGPFWAHKDIGAWTVPKGEYNENEDALTAARREFEEETGSKIDGVFTQLQSIKQKSGKIVSAWAVEGDIDASTVRSNTIQVEWPPQSSKLIEIPEVDKGEWFTLEAAAEKINPAQVPFLNELSSLLDKQ